MAEWSAILEEAVAFRHELHQNPELTWQEEATAQRVRQRLDSLEIPWKACAQYGTLARLAPQARGPHIALRGDMDALPIEEQTELAYRSRNSGCMHACGHDGHTAALWAAAAWLKVWESRLPGPVTLIFQPAEEGGHGARKMVEEGALEGVDRIYGWHNWPAIPFGQALCPDGPVMSGNGNFSIDIEGQGGHASQPELCRDPVLAAAATVLNLQQIVSRRLSPQAPAVVSATAIEAPSMETVIPHRARISGSIRLGRPELREPINQAIEEIAQGTAASYGVKARVRVEPRYQATVNHPDAAGDYRAALEAELGAHWQPAQASLPIMASEDFSYYLQQIPGAFALLGMGTDDGFKAPCHNPAYQFNDDLLAPVVRIFARLAGAPLP